MSSSDSNDLRQLDLRLLSIIRQRDELVKALAERGQLPTVGQENIILAQTIRDLISEAGDSIDDVTLSSLETTLRQIASHSRGQVRNAAVAFLGPKYSYSHLAAIKHFGEAATFAPVASIPAVFDAVHRGDAVSGLVPIENSTDGRIVDTLGMFVRRHMQICGEVLLPIHHNLLASGSRDDITEIHSKPQALSQCRDWLASNFPAARLIEVSSTTAAAESASTSPHIGAVASLAAGQAYGLTVINANIEDRQDNVTRFAVLGRDETEPTGDDKTSLLFQVEHQPGALAEAMTVFSEARLNLTWIESFPSPDSRNEYLFFVEFAGHRANQDAQQAIANLGTMTRRLEVLGSYPVARL
ncbi:prephenate dehydratase [Rhodopirellula sp. MGV]|uniref:prephenate dehydratase n=1 Tax=Rhodopirellula sp. MGV TaxID=2023130 RepID=UPI000B96E066|nr:prephenate dehydratase [Rhodopirellula sp. MGV]OYP37687.1 P-protein (PheA) [Rhodopirellula sp. MGV]PNY37125.1 prephenate dehydratase [Rhodopirellula baltica]